MNHTKWTYEIQCQPLIDLIEMCCKLGNQIGSLEDYLQPHTTKNIGILAILHQTSAGTALEKVGPVTILNVQYGTPFQRLKPIHIPYGKRISALAIGHGLLCFILLSTLITTYNLVFTLLLPSSTASCVPIFFFIMNHTNWTYEIEYQPLIDLMEMCCNLGNQIGSL
jgi:hypothetical protein